MHTLKIARIALVVTFCPKFDEQPDDFSFPHYSSSTARRASPSPVFSGDGGSSFPRPGAAWGNLNRLGGHAGSPTTTPGSHDVFVIAGYAVPKDGIYLLGNSFIQSGNNNCGEGTELKVLVNGQAIVARMVPNAQKHSFNTLLGTLQAGDVIYVASGPGETGSCDQFNWDYTITWFPAEHTNGLFSVFADSVTNLQRTRSEITSGHVVANYRRDYRPGVPFPGWAYLWNGGGPFGDPANCASR